jgi:hypothetical protein
MSFQDQGQKPKKNLYYIPDRHKVGAILRTTDDIKRFPVLEQAVNALLTLKEISLVHIIIHKPKSNDGIRIKLIQSFGREKKRIQFESLDAGNFYSDVLNFGLGEQVRRGIDYSLVMSSEAYKYATKENLQKMLEAAREGAYAVGLNIKEYSDFIEQGYISNAFCLYRNTVTNFVDVWELSSLLQDKKLDDKYFGSEELYVIKSFVEKYGYESLAVAEPETGELVKPEDGELRAQREYVIKTKKERFQEMCRLLRIDAESLKNNLRKIE